MARIERFEDLDAWREARNLTRLVYSLSRRRPFSRDFTLCDQLRRAALSVMNNIAEGWESVHLAEKNQAYNYSRRSAGEVRSMSYVVLDNEYASPKEAEELLVLAERAGELVSGLIRSTTARMK